MTALEIVEACGPAVLEALTVIAPVINKLAPALGFASDHPVLTGLAVLAGGGAAANIVARLLNQVPLGAWFGLLNRTARAVSAAGNQGVLRVIYNPFEAFLVKAVLGSARAVADGLTADNATCAVPPAAPQEPAR